MICQVPVDIPIIAASLLAGWPLLRLNLHHRFADESYEEMRERMLHETGRFIEWGLAHPHRVPHIPAYPVGKGEFSANVRRWFWEVVLTSDLGPPPL